MGIALLPALLLCGASMPAPEQMRTAQAVQERDAGPAPLSKEDAELIKDMALLERLELLKNLELFEEPQPQDAGPQRPQ